MPDKIGVLGAFCWTLSTTECKIQTLVIPTNYGHCCIIMLEVWKEGIMIWNTIYQV